MADLIRVILPGFEYDFYQRKREQAISDMVHARYGLDVIGYRSTSEKLSRIHRHCISVPNTSVIITSHQMAERLH